VDRGRFSSSHPRLGRAFLYAECTLQGVFPPLPPRFGRAKLRSETGEKNEGRFLTRCEKSSSVSLEFRACSRAISVLSRDSARSSENGNIFGDSGGSGTRRHSTNSPLIRRNVWPAGSAVVVAYGGRKTRVRMGFYEFTSPPCNPLVWRSQCE